MLHFLLFWLGGCMGVIFYAACRLYKVSKEKERQEKERQEKERQEKERHEKYNRKRNWLMENKREAEADLLQMSNYDFLDNVTQEEKIRIIMFKMMDIMILNYRLSLLAEEEEKENERDKDR